MMTATFATPIIIVTLLGLGSGVILSAAAKFFEVQKDERIENVRSALPGVNCGACGFAGCDEYAQKIVLEGAKINLCTPGADGVARSISEIMGVPFEDVLEKKAVVRCWGNYDRSEYVMDYQGPASCAACNLFYQGRRSCSSGCLGYGDCLDVCQYGAIQIIDGLAVIDPDLCTGCGACTKECPNHLITTISDTSKVYVACSSHDKGAYTRKVCRAGCIGCMKCQKTCRFDAITVTDNLASIDPDKCTNCQECVAVCPTHVIKVQ